MQIRIISPTPVRMACVKKNGNNCWQGCGGKKHTYPLLMKIQLGVVVLYENKYGNNFKKRK